MLICIFRYIFEALKMFDFKKGVILFHLYLLFVTSECQRIYCNEFLSPKKLITRGSRVDVIQLPLRGDKYSRNQLCEWVIECKEAETIVLEVKMCSIQDRDIHGQCNKDYVNIFDVRNGETVFMDRFCGTDEGMVYQSSGSTMIVRFFSDNVYEYSGFRLSYRAEKAESSSGHDMTVQLAVGIPVGILVTLMVVLFTVVMCRVYRKRRSNLTTYLNNTTSTPPRTSHSWNQQTTGPSTLSGTVGASSNRPGGRGPPSWGSYRGQGYDPSESQGLPLQVTLPEDQDGFAEYREGRSSPPPAYESLGYEDQAMTPPSYETVVKDSGEGHNMEDH